MEFIIKNLKVSVSELSRKIGYIIIDTNEMKEFNLVRRLQFDNYPRFHIYAKHAGDRLIINLHLDQKKPSYKGTHAHSGEYEGPVVEEEADRIKEILENL
jgi:hypothetical protein